MPDRPDPIKVAHVTENISRLSYGVGDVLWGFAEHGRGHGIEPIVVGVDDPHVREDVAGHPGVEVRTAPKRGPGALGYAPGVERALREAEGLDLVHMHGLWTLIGRHARRAARARGVPLVISPHGMLEAAASAHRPMRKRIAMALWEGANLRSAALLHATAKREARGFRGAGLDNPIAVIGNAIDPDAYTTEPDRAALDARFPQLEGQKLAVFLGRVHPIKGIDHLIRAWERLAPAHPEWSLAIAGPDDQGHLDRLRDAAKSALRLHFLGPVYGDDKRNLLAAADLFVQPSITENFGITIIESLISGAPVVTTTGTPWEELGAHGCGQQVEIGRSYEPSGEAVEALAGAIDRWMAMSVEQRGEAGSRGRELVLSRYTWPAVTAQLAQAYRWVLGGGERPAHVVAQGRDV